MYGYVARKINSDIVYWSIDTLKKHQLLAPLNLSEVPIMDNQLIRMFLYCSLVLILLYLNMLKFPMLALLYIAFGILEYFLLEKGLKVDNKWIIYSYRCLFLITGIIVIFYRDRVIG